MVECPFCKWKGKEFTPFGVKLRRNARCPKCGSLERHRLYYLYLRDILNPHEKIKLLHFAPEKIITSLIKQYRNIEYLSADISSKYAMVKEDITNTTFKSNTFDVIFCSHVLEHVDDDKQAMRELYRILTKGGSAILQVPINDMDKTYEDSTITDPKEREKAFGQKDHVRIYGRDYKDRLIESGFNVREDRYVDRISTDITKKYALSKETIYVCTKET